MGGKNETKRVASPESVPIDLNAFMVKHDTKFSTIHSSLKIQVRETCSEN